jgi:endonuclease/exonuclease/phosphatase family metal-dependent hydrolase
MMTRFLVVFGIFFFSVSGYAQEKKYTVACIGFYNVENYFDLIDHPEKRDEDFTPEGELLYTREVFVEKTANLAKVISEIGTEYSPDGLAILGLSEIENRSVIDTLVAHPLLRDRRYEVVHHESPDFRGIDVGLIYNPKYFELISSRSVPLLIYREDSSRIYTRDVLLVSGRLDGDLLHIMVNHWPSRRGGEKATQPLRNAGAALCRHLADSLRSADPSARVLIMGDLNDDPVSPSVKSVLRAKPKAQQLRDGDLYNPYFEYFKKGIGTGAYRDAWSLFDQIILSDNLVTPDSPGYHLYKANIFSRPYMIQRTGQFRGYPFRTYSFGTYIGGYSDHFPVYVSLIKEITP